MVHSEPPRRWWLHDAGPGQQGLWVRVQAAGAVWPHGAQPLLILQLSAHVQNKGYNDATFCTHPGIVTIHVLGGHWQPLLARLFKAFPKGGSRGRMKIRYVLCTMLEKFHCFNLWILSIVSNKTWKNFKCVKMHFAESLLIINFVSDCKLVCEWDILHYKPNTFMHYESFQ